MARKSLLVRMEITTAARAHDCRYNDKHRIGKGDKRLTVKVDRNNHHYCLACAKLFFEDSYARLLALKHEVDKLASSAGA